MSSIKSVYVETTIPSLATSRPSRDIIIGGRQAATLLFWENERQKYNLFVSQYVIDECSLGDVEAARRRLNFIEGITLVPRSDKIARLANNYQCLLGIPDRAKTDCFHLAACVTAQIDYLLSWNCTHLGIHTYSKIQKHNEQNGLFIPLLVTPESLIKIDEEEK